MRTIAVCLTAAFAAGLAHDAGGQTTATARWIALKESGFHVPAGTRAVDLLVEMNALLASPDPKLRDEVAYSAAEQWIVRDRKLDPDQLRQVRDLWLRNLRDGVGGPQDDRVYRRSFSMLCLSLVAAADVSSPFMSQPEYEQFLDATIAYFDAERDLRGFDPVHGWIHTVAHTSDTLKFLARNTKLTPDGAGRILAAMTRKLQSADSVFQWGEADRFARALLPIARKQPSLFKAWLQPWPDRATRVWANGPQVDPHEFARVENMKQILRSVYAAAESALAESPGSLPGLDESAKAVLATLSSMS